MIQPSLSNAYLKSNYDGEIQRKKLSALMLDLYCNGQMGHIRDILAQNHTSDAQKIIPVGLNIIQKIIRNLAMVYCRDATRTIQGTQADQDIFTEIETTSAIGVKMKQANRLSKLLGTVLLRPVWRGGHMELDVLTPNILDVETGDTPEELQSVLITHYDPVGNSDKTSFSLWTKESVSILDAQGQLASEEPNPYGVLPFVPCWNHPPTDVFWQSGARDLMMIQDAVNLMLADLGNIIRYQGHCTFYIKGAGPNDVNEALGGKRAPFPTGPAQLLMLPGDGEVGYAAPGSPIGEIMAVVEKLIKYAAVCSGLPASSISTEERRESGVARIVGNRELEEMRQDDLALFTEYERKLFSVFRAVWNAHNPGRKMGEAADFQINFYDPQQYTDLHDQVDAWQKLVEMGIISPVDIVMERDPDLSRDEAKEYLRRVREEQLDYGDQYTRDPYSVYAGRRRLKDYLKDVDNE